MKKLFFIMGAFSSLCMADTLHMAINHTVQPVHFVKEGKYAIAEGDIIIADLSRPSAVLVPKLGGTRWPHGIIPVEIDPLLPMKNKMSIYQAMLEWQARTNVEFIELTDKNKAQYSDYIHFIPATGTTCASWVGKKGGEQRIKLAPRCNSGNTVHEIGHALGLWHEQSRADRHAYIKIIWDNIEDSHRHNFEQHLTDGKDYGFYDYASIMHYSPFAFSKNGEKTIIPLQDGGQQMGQRERISERDIAAVNAMYPEL